MTKIADQLLALRGNPPDTLKRWALACLAYDQFADPASPSSKDDGSPRDSLRAGVRGLRERLEATIRKAEDVGPVLEDFELFWTGEQAELDRRMTMHTATLLIYWEQMPQVKWDGLDSKARAELFELLRRWRNGERETYLGKLPLEDRRKLEAMERRAPEDWDHPPQL